MNIFRRFKTIFKVYLYTLSFDYYDIAIMDHHDDSLIESDKWYTILKNVSLITSKNEKGKASVPSVVRNLTTYIIIFKITTLLFGKIEGKKIIYVYIIYSYSIIDKTLLRETSMSTCRNNGDQPHLSNTFDPYTHFTQSLQKLAIGPSIGDAFHKIFITAAIFFFTPWPYTSKVVPVAVVFVLKIYPLVVHIYLTADLNETEKMWTQEFMTSTTRSINVL